MRKTILALLAVFALFSCKTAAPVTECVNPLTYTDIPDPDVIRVGDDYYMVSTTMYYCPGAPIMHSRDLVHWRIINYVYDVIEDDDVYNLRNGQNAYGKGQWATSLKYHDGRYYALFIANDQHKTYVYSTDDIRGKWTRSVIDEPFHDASLLWDEGRCYVIWGNGEIYIKELTSDASAIKEGGLHQLLFSTPEGYMLRDEGARALKIGKYYYVFTIAWKREGVRTEHCWRSETLTGPYEKKVVLEGKFDGRNDGVAQGTIIDSPDGKEWYAIMFQDHGAVGRIPTLQHVSWTEDWPILGNNTLPEKTIAVALAEDEPSYVWADDEFSEPELQLVWQWNHKEPVDGWSLAEREGWLRLKPQTVSTGLVMAPGTLTQRTVGPLSRVEVKLDASGLKAGDAAGLSAFQSNYARIGVDVDENALPCLVAVIRNSGRVAETFINGKADGGEKELLRLPLSQKEVWLAIDYVFTPKNPDCKADQAWCSYNLEGENWPRIEEPLDMKFTLDYFTGYRNALYCYSKSSMGGYADFDYYRVSTTK